ncbi:helix-turn-helix transcriptional regulator [uncultured Shewanella sp.]|uniref:helix-turn-helix domain-containing protein n=1 Tax=uncultured Shewanella sp. TaxID=173975 RepID=UPI002622D80B|nr:helix-turn-helix transcriptional regulator [uncultured Shewanella sp.]
MTLANLKQRALQQSDVKAAYDDLSAEFELINTLLSMRQDAGLTQEEVALKMGTKGSNVSRLEQGKGNPSFNTLVKYAKACGCKLNFGFAHLN